MENMTKLQLNTLLQWSRRRGRNRSLAIIAEEERVSKTAVQKAMAKLEEYGYMNPDHELTEEGWAVAEAREKQLYLLKNWMRVHHVDASEWEDASVLLTEMGPSFIEVMTGEGLFCSICRGSADHPHETLLRGRDLSPFFYPAMYEAEFTLCQCRDETKLSMSDRAFEKPACFSVGKDYSEIILKRKKMVEKRPETDEAIMGMIRSMYYSVDGRQRSPKVSDNMIRIPSSDITWRCDTEQGVLSGRLEVSFTCTAMNHRPGCNTAVLHITISARDMGKRRKKSKKV
ncbi:MAG: hypothetical protein LUH21_16210 [Clostridiales bacterium]|nr:hypothetical protein [Clostridiales bacterium]